MWTDACVPSGTSISELSSAAFIALPSLPLGRAPSERPDHVSVLLDLAAAFFLGVEFISDRECLPFFFAVLCAGERQMIVLYEYCKFVGDTLEHTLKFKVFTDCD